jgi:hypothetical protein
MSLVPTFVKASDGMFYKEPILSGKDFFLCFDDDDDPELVIKVTESGLHWKMWREIAEEIIRKLGLDATLNTQEPASVSERCFGRGWKFSPAVAWFLTINKPIPVDKITKHEGRSKNHYGECVFYTFEEQA